MMINRNNVDMYNKSRIVMKPKNNFDEREPKRPKILKDVTNYQPIYNLDLENEVVMEVKRPSSLK